MGFRQLRQAKLFIEKLGNIFNMPVWSGVCISSELSQAYNIPAKIISFSLVNKSGGGVTVTVGIIYGSTFDVLYNKALSTATEFVYEGGEIILPPQNQIAISSSGAVDFYFSIE